MIAISVFIKRIVDDKILYVRTSARAEVLFYESGKTMEGRREIFCFRRKSALDAWCSAFDV